MLGLQSKFQLERETEVVWKQRDASLSMIFTSSVQIVLLQARLSSDQGSSAVRVLGVFLSCAGYVQGSQ